MTDKSANDLYKDIRTRYGDARANGYRLNIYFLREQEIIVSALKDKLGFVLDIGCGSGLMSLPLQEKEKIIVGLDFNEQACKAAKLNALNTIRGNAFSLPFANNSINNAYCCQFLNQQSHENVELLLSEAYRILMPRGEIILIWRNGDAIIHRVAHTLFKLYDALRRKPSFPVVNHPISDVIESATFIGFESVQEQSIFPLLRWRTNHLNGFLSRLIGASYFLILRHP